MRNELENKDAQIQDILNKLENEKNTPHTQKIYELNLGQMGGTTSKITLSTPQPAIPSAYKELVDMLGQNSGYGDSFDKYLKVCDKIDEDPKSIVLRALAKEDSGEDAEDTFTIYVYQLSDIQKPKY